MPRVLLNRWPGGHRYALTFSYDDGRAADRRLVELLNRYGLKGTFNLNSGKLGLDDHLTAAECPTLFEGHEVAIHSVTHPDLTALSDEGLRREILDDRRRLEDIMGRVVRGMAYPFGCYNRRVMEALREMDITYARTVETGNQLRPWGWYGLPDEWLAWHPSCHDRNNALEGFRSFLEQPGWRGLRLYSVWGHSYEFDQQKRWGSFEDFLRTAVAEADGRVWFATNEQVHAYALAGRRLEFSLGESHVYNPSARSVWLEVDGEVIEVGPGEHRQLGAG